MSPAGAESFPDRLTLGPSNLTPGKFKLVAESIEEEEAFDFGFHRKGVQGVGIISAVGQIAKGGLGAGVLSGHVAYKKIGVWMAVPLSLIFGVYMWYCLHILVKSGQKLCKRMRVPRLSYSDVGEAACACFPHPRVKRLSWSFRMLIDTCICLVMFGTCPCYQIIIAKSLKQLVENTQETDIYGKGEGYPSLRMYMVIMIVPYILICSIRHLHRLAPFSLAADTVVFFCIVTTIYYAFKNNPYFENMIAVKHDVFNLFEFLGMNIFTISCTCVVIPVENSMKNPKDFPLAFLIGMSLIVICTFLVSIFGYVGYLEQSESPITVNFPMTTVPIILKGAICIMIYVTHALTFWVPFNSIFFYMKKYHNEENLMKWELFYRAIFVVILALFAILFPNIDNWIGFIGALCDSNLGFIWPNLIGLMVIWERPGLGKFYWRLWQHLALIFVGVILLVCGTAINGYALWESI